MSAIENARPWRGNSERLQIHMGICGDEQESSFMNATLQRTGNDPALEFSIATHVEIPALVRSEESLAGWLGLIFDDFVHEHPEVRIEIQLGSTGDSQNAALGFDEGAECENAARELGEED